MAQSLFEQFLKMQTKEKRNPFQSWRQNGSSLRGFDNRKLKFALPDYASRNRHQADVRPQSRVMKPVPASDTFISYAPFASMRIAKHWLEQRRREMNTEQVQHPFATLDRNQGHVKPWIYIFLTGYWQIFFKGRFNFIFLNVIMVALTEVWT